MKIKYRTYVEDNGRQNWVYDDNLSGTTGQNKKIYGIQIKLEGTEDYIVEFKIHQEEIGWSKDWIQNGETAGNISNKKKIEAIQIRIVKGKDTDKNLGVEYVAHVQDEGWQDFKENGQEAGTTGKNRKVEAIKIQLKNNPEGT